MPAPAAGERLDDEQAAVDTYEPAPRFCSCDSAISRFENNVANVPRFVAAFRIVRIDVYLDLDFAIPEQQRALRVVAGPANKLTIVDERNLAAAI